MGSNCMVSDSYLQTSENKHLSLISNENNFFYGFNATGHQIPMYSTHLTTFTSKVTKMLEKTSFVLDLLQHGVKLYGFGLIFTDF